MRLVNEKIGKEEEEEELEGMYTNLIGTGVHEIGRCCEALVVFGRRLLADVVGSAELDIGVFEVRLNTGGPRISRLLL